MTGSYVIEAAGASGGDGTDVSVSPVHRKPGGLGAKITGTFQLNQGTKLKILVGQEGTTVTVFQRHRPGTGGGGSFVTLLDHTPLIVAGGGGGGGARDNFTNGDPGQATRNGSQCGGTQGGGGKVCNANTGREDFSFSAGGGAGIRGNGSSPLRHSPEPLAARSFITGGTGGQCLFSDGGFGGGAFALNVQGGGGGGYSGGGVLSTYKRATAGGGGSYNVGKNQQNLAGANKGDGKVVITLVADP